MYNNINERNEYTKLLDQYFFNEYVEGDLSGSFFLTRKTADTYKRGALYMSKRNKRSILIIKCHEDDFANIESLKELEKKYYGLKEKYQQDYLVIFVSFGNNCLNINLITGKYYYTIKDILFLIEKYSNNIIEVKDKINNNDFQYNDVTARLTYRKYNNEIINTLYEEEFGCKCVIGSIVQMCIDMNPTSYYDFCNQYFVNAEENKHLLIKERGITKEESIELAMRFSRRVNEVTKGEIIMTPVEAFHFLMYLIINRPFIGYFAEKKLTERFIQYGYLVYKPDINKDKDYGIDLEVKKDNEKYFIQVKPNTILIKKPEKELKELFQKHKLTLRDFNKETLYAFYSLDKDDNFIWKTNTDNSFLFNLNIFN